MTGVLSALTALTAFAPLAVVAAARDISLPVRPDKAFIRHAIVSQMFTGEHETARVWDDGSGCNFLVLSNPEVEIIGGRMRIDSKAEARVGQRVGDRCLVVTDWAGTIETTQKVSLEEDGQTVRFEVVDSRLRDGTRRRGMPVDVLWDWVKRYVHPRIGAVRINLHPALEDLKSVLRLALQARESELRNSLDSMSLQSVEVEATGLRVDVAMQVPDTPAEPRKPTEQLSPAELARFESNWQGWDGFLTFVVKHFAASAPAAEARRELLDVLIEARYDLVTILASDPALGEPDPVRALFVETWSRLAPILRRLSSELPGDRALNLLSFITAADALQALDALGPQLDIDISVDGLRRLARILAPEREADPLDYHERVDPELRKLFDFGPPLPLRQGALLPSHGWWRGVLRPAHAGVSVDNQLAERLNRWIPPPEELEAYLQSVHRLLTEIGGDLAADSELEPDYHEMYRILVLTTAWQETCWRQYTRAGGRIVPIRSPAGAVGLMQVVPSVWRGFYDPRGLSGDIAYNATAGGEILLHYLMNYAIARGEHRRTGGLDNLAWATYAAYNGGPGHLNRYRRSDTSESLRQIDLAFREKFQRMQNGEELAVRSCYAG